MVPALMNSHEHRSLLPPALGPDGDYLLDHLPGDAQFPCEVGLRESLGKQRLHDPARPGWYDAGRFWSGDDLRLSAGARLGGEIAVQIPAAQLPAASD